MDTSIVSTHSAVPSVTSTADTPTASDHEFDQTAFNTVLNSYAVHEDIICHENRQVLIPDTDSILSPMDAQVEAVPDA